MSLSRSIVFPFSGTLSTPMISVHESILYHHKKILIPLDLLIHYSICPELTLRLEREGKNGKEGGSREKREREGGREKREEIELYLSPAELRTFIPRSAISSNSPCTFKSSIFFSRVLANDLFLCTLSHCFPLDSCLLL